MCIHALYVCARISEAKCSIGIKDPYMVLLYSVVKFYLDSCGVCKDKFCAMQWCVCGCGCGCVCVARVAGWGWRHFSNYLYHAAPRGRCNETSPCKTPVSGMLSTPLHFSCTVWSHSMCKAASVGNIFAEVGRSQPQTRHKWDIASFSNSSNQLEIICFIGLRCLK